MSGSCIKQHVDQVEGQMYHIPYELNSSYMSWFTSQQVLLTMYLYKAACAVWLVINVFIPKQTGMYKPQFVGFKWSWILWLFLGGQQLDAVSVYSFLEVITVCLYKHNDTIIVRNQKQNLTDSIRQRCCTFPLYHQLLFGHLFVCTNETKQDLSY